ncbi:glycoside hydrolase family 3 protein [Firmicutes bacterium i23-0019-B6]
MNMFGDIPHGKEDLPILIPMKAPEYNIDDVDGAEYMLNHKLEGCYCFFCTKKIGNMEQSKVVLDGNQEVEIVSGVCQFGPHRETIVGVCVQPYLTEYDKEYVLHIEGIEDVDGNVMEPMEFPIHTLPKSQIDPVHHERDEVTLEVAREGIVLLKNEENILPLGANAKINVFGSGFAKFRVGCSGAGRINPRYMIRLFDGIENYSSIQMNEELKTIYRTATDNIPEKDVLTRAKEWSETAVIAISRGTSENFDNLAVKGEFYLTDEEENLIRQVSEAFENTVLLINSGYPMDVRCVEKYGIKAVLWTGLCGMNGGRAVAEILEGTVNPSGKLPDTWSFTWEEIPSSANFYQPESVETRINGGCEKYINTVYEEGLYVGYRYFDTFSKPVAYGFGHGLSYTTFAYEYKLSKWETPETLDTIAAEVEAIVTNTGACAGKEVIQLYAKIPDGKLEQPSHRLIGFVKTKILAPRESQKLIIAVKGRELASFDAERAAWICEAGAYELEAGNSLEQSSSIAKVEIKEEKLLKQSKNYMSTPKEIPLVTLSKKAEQETYPKGRYTKMTEEDHITPVVEKVYGKEKNPIHPEKSERLIQWKGVLENPKLLEDFIGQFTDYELARVSVCAKNGWGMEAKGEAGMLYVSEKYNTPEFIVADGNNGVNLRIENIGFPTSVTVCATFNEELAYKTGATIAEEAKEHEINEILAPAINLHRNPLCGRAAEYFSEDPLLAGRMGGQQSRGLEEHGVVSCMKHLLANNCESSRLRNNSIMDERTLRELYLKTFEEAFQVQVPSTVMTAYNAVNSVYCAESEDMLQGIFLEELGFDGFVMTDWTSSDTCDIANAMAAGNGWITPGGMDDAQTMQLVEGIQNGRIDRKRLEKSVYRMMKVVLKFL